MEATRSVLQLFSFDYTQSLARNYGLGGCLLPFSMKQNNRKQLLSKGVKLMIDQIAKDLQSSDVEVVQQALVVAKDLMLAHNGDSKELVVTALKDEGVVQITAQIFMHCSIQQLKFLACQCLAELLADGEYLEQVLEDGIVSKMVEHCRQPSDLTPVVLSLMLVMLKQKEELLHVLIALERSDAPNVLLSLLLVTNNYSQITLLKVLQIILKKSHLAVKQLLLSQGLEVLSRWLANFKEKATTPQFKIGFEIILDLITKHENLSEATKLQALSQLHQGGVANIVTRALMFACYQARAIYALSQICQVQGATDVVAHLLQRGDYRVLANAACRNFDEDQKLTTEYACVVLRYILDSTEGYQALRCLAQCRGLAQLIQHSELSDFVVNKGCSHGGQSILLGLSYGKQKDVIAAAESLAAIAIVQPALCATTLMHNNLLITLIHECLQQIKTEKISNQSNTDENEKSSIETQKSTKNESIPVSQIENPEKINDNFENDTVIVDIVQKLFGTLPVPSPDEIPFGRSTSLSQQYQQQYAHLDRNNSSPIERQNTLQSQISSHSTRSSLSRNSSNQNSSIPREEVNLKRYDSTTFVVGGRECYAMGWIMEQQSPYFYKQLSGMKNVQGERVMVPRVPGISEEKMYEMFQLALEFAYTKNLEQIDEKDVLALWAVSRELEMLKLQEFCEDLISEEIVFGNDENLSQVLSWLLESSSNLKGDLSGKIWGVCVDGIVNRFQIFRENGILKQLVNKYVESLTVGMAANLRKRLQHGFQEIEIHVSTPEVPECSTSISLSETETVSS
eukprot:TRINITY_DN12603_c0_g3_i1.p1 TRINITY_DN12603_c0_g3~~TRINITY_DN12603_c0_g3_i1.p1  ORF type:complete len:838 (+),score=146.71 TRINITY_DN12603_c0_g3_i1:127-2514(+)